jgi:hypothetical protein
MIIIAQYTALEQTNIYTMVKVNKKSDQTDFQTDPINKVLAIYLVQCLIRTDLAYYRTLVLLINLNIPINKLLWTSIT